MSELELFALPPVADGRGLHPITNRGGARLWCGPAALAAASGWDAADTQEVCSRVAGHKTRGLRRKDMEAAARTIGLALSGPCRVSGSPTLREWATWERDPGCYIVLVTGHFAVVNGARFVDSHSPQGCAVSRSWCAGRHVRAWWKVEEKTDHV